jgi:hypothetical protein
MGGVYDPVRNRGASKTSPGRMQVHRCRFADRDIVELQAKSVVLQKHLNLRNDRCSILRTRLTYSEKQRDQPDASDGFPTLRRYASSTLLPVKVHFPRSNTRLSHRIAAPGHMALSGSGSSLPSTHSDCRGADLRFLVCATRVHLAVFMYGIFFRK